MNHNDADTKPSTSISHVMNEPMVVQGHEPIERKSFILTQEEINELTLKIINKPGHLEKTAQLFSRFPYEQGVSMNVDVKSIKYDEKKCMERWKNPDAIHQFAKAFNIDPIFSFVDHPGLCMPRKWTPELQATNPELVPLNRKKGDGTPLDDGYEDLVEDYLTLRELQNADWAEQQIKEGERFERVGNNEKAIKAYTHVVELVPKLTSARYARAKLYCQMNKWKEARSDLVELLKEDPNHDDWISIKNQIDAKLGVSSTEPLHNSRHSTHYTETAQCLHVDEHAEICPQDDSVHACSSSSVSLESSNHNQAFNQTRHPGPSSQVPECSSTSTQPLPINPKLHDRTHRQRPSDLSQSHQKRRDSPDRPWSSDARRHRSSGIKQNWIRMDEFTSMAKNQSSTYAHIEPKSVPVDTGRKLKMPVEDEWWDSLCIQKKSTDASRPDAEDTSSARPGGKQEYSLGVYDPVQATPITGDVLEFGFERETLIYAFTHQLNVPSIAETEHNSLQAFEQRQLLDLNVEPLVFKHHQIKSMHEESQLHMNSHEPMNVDPVEGTGALSADTNIAGELKQGEVVPSTELISESSCIEANLNKLCSKQEILTQALNQGQQEDPLGNSKFDLELPIVKGKTRRPTLTQRRIITDASDDEQEIQPRRRSSNYVALTGPKSGTLGDEQVTKSGIKTSNLAIVLPNTRHKAQVIGDRQAIQFNRKTSKIKKTQTGPPESGAAAYNSNFDMQEVRPAVIPGSDGDDQSSLSSLDTDKDLVPSPSALVDKTQPETEGHTISLKRGRKPAMPKTEKSRRGRKPASNKTRATVLFSGGKEDLEPESSAVSAGVNKKAPVDSSSRPSSSSGNRRLANYPKGACGISDEKNGSPWNQVRLQQTTVPVRQGSVRYVPRTSIGDRAQQKSTPTTTSFLGQLGIIDQGSSKVKRSVQSGLASDTEGTATSDMGHVTKKQKLA